MNRITAEKIVAIAMSRPDKIFVSDDLLHLFPRRNSRREVRKLLKESLKAGFIERTGMVCRSKNEGTAYIGYRVRGVDPGEIINAIQRRREGADGAGTGID